MIGELLLFLMVTDLREASDQELRDFLEVLVSNPDVETSRSLQDLRDKALEQLVAEAPNRESLAAWPHDFSELLPENMKGYEETLVEFEAVLEGFFDGADVEELVRVERFRGCLELLDESSSWQDRAEAARGLASMEEESFQTRQEYTARGFKLAECSPESVILHQYCLEGFEVWREAFSLVHQEELDEALEAAVEASCYFAAVQALSPMALNQKDPGA